MPNDESHIPANTTGDPHRDTPIRSIAMDRTRMNRLLNQNSRNTSTILALTIAWDRLASILRLLETVQQPSYDAHHTRAAGLRERITLLIYAISTIHETLQVIHKASKERRANEIFPDEFLGQHFRKYSHIAKYMLSDTECDEGTIELLVESIRYKVGFHFDPKYIARCFRGSCQTSSIDQISILEQLHTNPTSYISPLASELLSLAVVCENPDSQDRSYDNDNLENIVIVFSQLLGKTCKFIGDTVVRFWVSNGATTT